MKFLLWLNRRIGIELKVALITLGVLIVLPAFSVVVLASSGISFVGQALAAVNPVSHLVEIFDANGNKVHELELSTTWPTTGYVSDEFGAFNPVRKLLGLNRHTAIDIANERHQVGTPVTPFMVGKVVKANPIDDSACGKSVKVEHGNGITSLYCHLNATAASVNTDVKPGDVIGYMGSTGASTGPHLHFQTMVYGIPVNPRIFMVGEPARTY